MERGNRIEGILTHFERQYRVNKDGSLFLYEKKSAKPGTTGTTEKPEYEIKPKAEA